MNFDINDPKVRWAQQIADRTGEKQVIINNAVGGYSIKPQRVVHLQSPDIQVFIEPRNNRLVDKEEGGVLGAARVAGGVAMSQHTPEPWQRAICKTGIYDEDGCLVACTDISLKDEGTDGANARRIVACVNRLATFTTEQIEDDGFDLANVSDWIAREQAFLEQTKRALRQRDELLAALKLFHSVWESLHPLMPLDQAQKLLGAAYESTKQIAAKCESKSPATTEINEGLYWDTRGGAS